MHPEPADAVKVLASKFFISNFFSYILFKHLNKIKGVKDYVKKKNKEKMLIEKMEKERLIENKKRKEEMLKTKKLI